ncbi:carbon-nitrogen hydrolase family protein [Ferviditalea candida]|uniref:Carbon-nitrogen hydrolase family protein n=1 Tax=Ferviditalea candida TaxID=3108399 RepID=A0ABU5ZQY9_9BACL|nr:carbon-nitrogen hydrolase family protein [Paenibacillaceae bacterium T2]
MPNIFLAQSKPKLLDKTANLQTMKRYLEEAQVQRADIVLFPELFLTGYFTREHTLELAEDIEGESIRLIRSWHVQQVYIQSRAAENQVFVAMTNQIGIEETTEFFGESAAANSFGQLLFKADDQEGGYLISFDLRTISEARAYPLVG